jgi:hypothetical protein
MNLLYVTDSKKSLPKSTILPQLFGFTPFGDSLPVFCLVNSELVQAN